MRVKELFIITTILFATAVHADYLYDAKSMDRWQRVDTHTIILSRGSTPKAVVTLPYCYIYASSSLTILTETLGNWDGKILVDNEVCDVREVKKIG